MEAHGWLTKQGHMMPTWKKRYFILVMKPTVRLLYYAERPPSPERVIESEGQDGGNNKPPQGEIPLAGAKFGKKDDGHFGFEIISADGKSFPLRGVNEVERGAWIEVIQEVFDMVGDHAGEPASIVPPAASSEKAADASAAEETDAPSDNGPAEGDSAASGAAQVPVPPPPAGGPPDVPAIPGPPSGSPPGPPPPPPPPIQPTTQDWGAMSEEELPAALKQAVAKLHQTLNAFRLNPRNSIPALRDHRMRAYEFDRDLRKYKLVRKNRPIVMLKEGTEAAQEALDWLQSDEGRITLKPLEYDVELSKVSEERIQAHLAHAASEKSAEQLLETPCESRVSKYGTWSKTVGESFVLGEDEAREIVLNLLVDDGAAQRENRVALLNPIFKKVGIAMQPHPTQGLMVALTYAGRFERHPPPKASAENLPELPPPPSADHVAKSVAADIRQFLTMTETGHDMEEYEAVITSSNKLGIQLEPREGKGALEGETCELVVVKALQPGGSCQRAGVTVGSHLLFINGQTTHYCGYQGAMDLLKGASRPLTLRFARPVGALSGDLFER